MNVTKGRRDTALTVLRAEEKDIPQILAIYASARRFMRENGNPDQWEEGYPPKELLTEDLRKKRLFVLTEGRTIRGVFVFAVEEEPTYRVIEDGAWLSDAPYGVIHRIAGDGEARGIFRTALRYAEGITGHLRIDTHEKNRTMRRLICEAGFRECGVIRVRNGSKRLAFEKLSGKE